MAPNSTIHLVRHAEGYHQLPRDHPDVKIRDALLTETGFKQATDFCGKFPYHDKTDLLCASPLRRTIQTAQLAFAPEVERNLRIFLLPNAQEASEEPSDTGSAPADINAHFKDVRLDCSLLTEDWFIKEGVNAPDEHALRDRAKDLRLQLRERPEEHIVLVTHGLFAHYVTDHVDPEGHKTGEYWQNVMWRTYKFSEKDTERAHLVETVESRERHPRRKASTVTA